AQVPSLRESASALRPPPLRRSDPVRALPAPPGEPGLDPPALELLLGHLVTLGPLVQDLSMAEDEPRLVLLGLDLHLRGEPCARELRAHGLAELRLRQQQEILRA